MLKSPCLFVALESFWPSANTYRLPVSLPPVLHRIVADHRAMGYGIIPVGGADYFGVISERERLTLQTDVEVAFAMRGRIPVRTVVLLENARDPSELWHVARCFDIELRDSMLLTSTGHHAGIARTAGVGHITSEAELSRTLAFA